MFDVVMPLFNKEPYVARTIDSVLEQSFEDWKLYVVDDGSSDAGVAVVESFDDPRISIIQQENAGPGVARNTGILAGSADWIAFLDADDLWMPDHLRTLDEICTRFPEAVLIGAAYRQWTGGNLPEMSGERASRLVHYFREASRGSAPFFTSSAAFRRDAVERVGLLPPVVVGDEMDLWARLALDGPVAASTRQTVLYRVGTGGITDSSASERVTRLEQVSVPVATLLDRLHGISDEELRRDVTDYIDFETGLALMRAVRSGQIDNARRLLRLFLVAPRGKARIAALLARLPAPLGQELMHLIFAWKRALRSN